MRENLSNETSISTCLQLFLEKSNETQISSRFLLSVLGQLRNPIALVDLGCGNLTKFENLPQSVASQIHLSGIDRDIRAIEEAEGTRRAVASKGMKVSLYNVDVASEITSHLVKTAHYITAFHLLYDVKIRETVFLLIRDELTPDATVVLTAEDESSDIFSLRVLLSKLGVDISYAQSQIDQIEDQIARQANLYCETYIIGEQYLHLNASDLDDGWFYDFLLGYDGGFDILQKEQQVQFEKCVKKFVDERDFRLNIPDKALLVGKLGDD